LEIYNLITIIIIITAAFGYINFKFIKLPATIGIMLISVVASLIVIGIGATQPKFFYSITHIIRNINFYTALMQVMLGFLLFAGSMHIDIKKLRKERASVITFATVGVVLSTFIIGILMYLVTGWFGVQIDFLPCLLFGALISPTDPIAVLGILKQANIPPSLEMKITGESLFNDGVAVVVFTTITEVMRIGISNVSAGSIIWLFLEEACGGFVFGLLLGYAGFLALKSIDNYTIEVLITLAIVMGGYSLANYLHISGPLAIVAAGIVTGNRSLEYGTSDVTRDYMTKFWEMIDEVMNAILFLLIGFEMLVIPFTRSLLWLGCAAILIVLAARFLSVALPVEILKQRRAFERNAIAILTWGGLRGGISVALALSLPYNDTNRVLVSVTYFVVLFSILVQGLTIGKIARKLAT
jgi:CPA1 family monovalent cation:H+ antiporter